MFYAQVLAQEFHRSARSSPSRSQTGPAGRLEVPHVLWPVPDFAGRSASVDWCRALLGSTGTPSFGKVLRATAQNEQVGIV
jgi:hypothetical protein